MYEAIGTGSARKWDAKRFGSSQSVEGETAQAPMLASSSPYLGK